MLTKYLRDDIISYIKQYVIKKKGGKTWTLLYMGCL